MVFGCVLAKVKGTDYATLLCVICGQALNIIGESPWSEEACYTTQATTPDKPDGLLCTASGPSTAVVSWNLSHDGGAPIKKCLLVGDDGKGGGFKQTHYGTDRQVQAHGLHNRAGYKFKVLAENEVRIDKNFDADAVNTFIFTIWPRACMHDW